MAPNLRYIEPCPHSALISTPQTLRLRFLCNSSFPIKPLQKCVLQHLLRPPLFVSRLPQRQKIPVVKPPQTTATKFRRPSIVIPEFYPNLSHAFDQINQILDVEAGRATEFERIEPQRLDTQVGNLAKAFQERGEFEVADFDGVDGGRVEDGGGFRPDWLADLQEWRFLQAFLVEFDIDRLGLG